MSPSDSPVPAVPDTFNRRDLLKVVAATPLALASTAVSAQSPDLTAARRSDPLERGAARWQTWLAPSVSGLRPGVPPRGVRLRAELNELLTLQRKRSDATNQIVQFWDAQGGVPAWNAVFLEKVKEAKTDPVLTSRALALLHTAMADATIAVWDAKFRFNRLAPFRLDRRIRSVSQVQATLPSYPSEHAAVAGAAATVLSYLYPAQTVLVNGARKTWDALGNEAAISRLWAGANTRTDLAAGFRMGQAIAFLAVQRGATDGSNAVWDSVNQARRPTGPQHWVPTPPANAFPPLHPLAGYWNPWLLSSGDQFRPQTPSLLQGEFPNAQFLAETQEVKTFVDNLGQNPEHLTIAQFWADGGGTVTPPGHWMEFARAHAAAAQWSTPRAARAMALLAVGLADAAICCWDAKYAYWLLRPITAIRTMSDQPFYDPNFVTAPGVPTPPFPSFTSGHSTFSGCAARILEYLFPGGTVTDALGQSVSFEAAADQAGLSRVYAGIHYRSDSTEGLVGGRQVAQLVINRAQKDRA